MMFQYPYLNSPYYRYSRYGYHYPNASSYRNGIYSQRQKNYNHVKENINSKTVRESINTKTNCKDKSATISEQPKKEERSSNSEDSPLFQILGIDLYFDDILLVCLIFFLYQEGVKDESLFIALILLLLS